MSSQISWQWRAFNELSGQDVYDILALRQAIFIIEQQCIYPDIDYKDKLAQHLLAKNEKNQLCAYLRLLPASVSYPDAISFGRLGTASFSRGKGLAKAAVLKALQYLKKTKNTLPIIISAQIYLKDFYSTFGFTPVGEPYDEDGILHIEMHKESL